MKQSVRSNKTLTIISLLIVTDAAMAFYKKWRDTVFASPVAEEFHGIWVNSQDGTFLVSDRGATRFEYTRQTCMQVDNISKSQTNES